VELLLVESGVSSANVEVAGKIGAWATGDWLRDKFYDPEHDFREVSVDHTTEGFDESKLIRLGDLAEQAA